jgi:hypothetical protein
VWSVLVQALLSAGPHAVVLADHEA